jgi:Protein of unknown function (DUF2948)
MPDLKLVALDANDLSVISAHLQDAVVRMGDMTYLPREKRFAAIMNRFDWLTAAISGAAPARENAGQRRRTGVRFERVLASQAQGLNLTDKVSALALLAITFEPNTAPETVDGHVTLTFSGGAAIRLRVECLEVEMKDLGAAWTAKHVPTHPETET